MEKQLGTNFAMAKGMESYKSNFVLTRTPEQLILDLYDGCIKFIDLSLEGFAQESYEKISNNLIKAGAIVDELTVSLNFEKGGEIAKNFLSLYTFIGENLLQGNIKKSRKNVEDARKIVMLMRETWYNGVIKDKA